MAEKKKKKGKVPRGKRLWLYILAGIAVLALVGAGIGYHYLFQSNLNLKQRSDVLYLYPGDDYPAVVEKLKLAGLENESAFRTVCSLMHYDKVRPGRYRLRNGMNNRQLVGMLRAGLQEPVRFSFISQRTLTDFINLAEPQFLFSRQELADALQDPKLLAELGATPETLPAYLMPETYQMFWTISAPDFLRRLKKEYDKYWNAERKARAKAQGLTPLQVMIVASIVEAETNQNSEKPTVAGVYLNRLRRNMRLEADPTVKFALQDFAIKRILTRHIEESADSPYNTYRHEGLPPGPINMPEKSSVEAVLKAPRHDYIYFCASAERPGFHTFSRTLAEHNAAAKAYHAWLNKQRIY